MKPCEGGGTCCADDCDSFVEAEGVIKMLQLLADSLPDHVDTINGCVEQVFPWHGPVTTTKVVPVKCQHKIVGCDHPENATRVCGLNHE